MAQEHPRAGDALSLANRLANESSAYLRQYKDNPVDGYPWGSEALERAKREDKPLLVSIGYSSCHWCHVMEHESFENLEIAKQMNASFICIKVDREERPAVDQIYMDTVLRRTGSGGWPLNVFCTPQGVPFHGRTDFPPARRHGSPSGPEVLEAVATRGLASRTRKLLGSEDAVVVLRPDAAPAWLAPCWLEGREPRDATPTAYLCRGRT